jgi:hypothetical protein
MIFLKKRSQQTDRWRRRLGLRQQRVVENTAQGLAEQGFSREEQAALNLNLSNYLSLWRATSNPLKQTVTGTVERLIYLSLNQGE